MKYLKIWLWLLISVVLSCEKESDSSDSDFWEQTNKAFDRTVNVLAINSRGDIFAGTEDSGIFRSSDNGNNWTPINNGLITTRVIAIAISPSGHLFAVTIRGVFRSIDNGNTWTPAGLTNVGIQSLALKSNGHIFAGSLGIFRSTDNGDNWTPINTGLTDLDVRALAINADGYIFAGTGEHGVFRSMDNGNTWMPTNNGLPPYRLVQAFAINSPGHLFASSVGRIFRSTDAGENWTFSAVGTLSDLVRAMTINTSGYIFAGAVFVPSGPVPGGSATGGGAFRSTDNGNTWTPINTGLANADVRALANNASGRIFAGTEIGVFRSVKSTTMMKTLANEIPTAF
jgi:photosystem II stability/assembly factor-like uncharacterized protein